MSRKIVTVFPNQWEDLFKLKQETGISVSFMVAEAIALYLQHKKFAQKSKQSK